jgi:hypothetical protein
MQMITMFLLLLTTGVGLSGITGYLIFGPLAYRHLQDRGALIGLHAFSPAFLSFVLRGQFRSRGDRNLNGLATPAQVLLWSCILGTVGSAILVTLYQWQNP